MSLIACNRAVSHGQHEGSAGIVEEYASTSSIRTWTGSKIATDRAVDDRQRTAAVNTSTERTGCIATDRTVDHCQTALIKNTSAERGCIATDRTVDHCQTT